MIATGLASRTAGDIRLVLRDANTDTARDNAARVIRPISPHENTRNDHALFADFAGLHHYEVHQ